jgi:FkbM family methyltransferase
MMRKLWTDFWGLRRVCGTRMALRWLGCVVTSLPSVLKARNLQPADLRMGQGPYRLRVPGRSKSVLLSGYRVVSHIREMWVRNVYGLADLPSGGTVVDLGAHHGYFTAAAAGAGNRVIAVEASRPRVAAIQELTKLNGWQRVAICNAFIGGATQHQDDQQAIPDHDGVPYISIEELVARYGVERIDFLKCDIEGSEFGLFFGPCGSRLLEMTNRLAMEVHYDSGDVRALLGLLERSGFRTLIQSESAGDCIVRAHKVAGEKRPQGTDAKAGRDLI